MLKNHCLYLLLSISLLGNAQQAANQEIEAKVETLLAKMTLKEKIGQMNQYNGFWNVTGSSTKRRRCKSKIQSPSRRLCWFYAERTRCKRSA